MGNRYLDVWAILSIIGMSIMVLAAAAYLYSEYTRSCFPT